MHYLTFILLLISTSCFAQDQLNVIDIEKYNVTLHVTDSSNEIFVSEAVTVKFLEDCPSFYLDLHTMDASGNGMIIDYKLGVFENDVRVDYALENNKLTIEPKNGTIGAKNTYTFSFNGVPGNGLIIGKNKFGDRTFFGDNWPNRAHNWFACVDHPSDKALMHFTVVTPEHYECVATGVLTENNVNEYGERVSVFTSDIPLPTKVMVVGIADFAVQEVASDLPLPISSWVYPQDSIAGFYDMSIAPKVTSFFISTIGEYPYEKLANVQSTTMFGGMENAGNIFYDENAVKGKGTMEALIAHEIAHQWFGNSASEEDWQHLWLSEGFATYFTDLYFEATYGEKAMQSRLINERKKVISFSKKYAHPVIDTTYDKLITLLNPHSYQKGAWFLHMLRNKISDASFWKGIKAYYATYAFSNASTDDFMHVMEEASNIELTPFFDQWLRTFGQPVLSVKTKRKKIILTQTQLQQFEFPIQIQFEYRDGTSEIAAFHIRDTKTTLAAPQKKTLKHIVLDPYVKLLFEKK